jgi:site-specific DNA-methyltransferase (adenine-specific)/modification methylase
MEYITNNVAIVHGDCLDMVGEWPADAAIVTDPPYGIGYVHSGTGQGLHLRRNAMAIHGDDQPFDPAPFLRFRWVLLWGADHFRSRLPEGGTMLAWDKSCGKGPADKFVDCEFAWCNRDGVKRNCCGYLWKGIACLKKGEDGGRRYHPTQKPVGLCTWCLSSLALPPGTLVIDPFMGVGSMGIACLRSGMRYLGVEIERQHYDKAAWRLRRESEK